MKRKTSVKTKVPASKRRDPANTKDKATGFPIVGVGASAGGLEAFSELLQNLPEKIGMAFVLVQHLDPSHRSFLREILSRVTRMPVAQVNAATRVEPDHVYVAPADKQLGIRESVLRLESRPVTERPMPIDSFFASLAAERGDRAIGVILSGMASDGTEGCTAIKAAGGITFAQDVETAQYSGMPQSAIKAGCVNFVRSPEGIAKELSYLSQHPYLFSQSREEKRCMAPGSDWRELVELLRKSAGVDFQNYKQRTLQRRVERRMIQHKTDTLSEYVRYIRDHPGELDQLYKDVLIHVTGFFRRPEAFESLRELVFPNLFRDDVKERGPIRVWVPGCSTGEEVYSIAIILLEYLRGQERYRSADFPSTRDIQIFATDISEAALERARSGVYSEAALAKVSQERLRGCFVPKESGFEIRKEVRQLCVFAKQDVTRDPPFSNLDLITCRNLLIYLGPVLHNRVVPALHYALKPGGYLMLGESESLGSFSDHFTLLDKKHRIYKKNKGSMRLSNYFAGSEFYARRGEEALQPAGLTVEKEVDRLLLSRYVPPSIVINENMEIVQMQGRTGEFLEVSAGRPTFNLSKMAGKESLVALRAALTRAKQMNAAVRKKDVLMRTNGGLHETAVEILPFQSQSTNEELETAKEELQSSNEELATLNEELQRRNAELSGANNDLLNLFENVRVPVVMIDNELRIRRFTPAGQTLLNLIPADIGRRVGEVRPNVKVEDLESVARAAIDSGTMQDREVREETGTWYLMRIRPYLTWDRKIEGAVITFQDIDALKRTLEQTRSYADALFGSARESILLLNSDLRVLTANAAFCWTLGVKADDVKGQFIFELGEGRWNVTRLRSMLEDMLQNNSRIDEYEMHVALPLTGDRLMVLNAHRVDAEPGSHLILLSIEDVTDKRKQLDAVRRQAALLELAHDAVIVRDIEGRIQFWNRGAEEMYGFSKEEAVGKVKQELLQAQYPKPWKEIETELLRYGFWEGEVIHVRKDGSSRNMQSRWALRREGGSAVVLEINSDITEKKRSEENLRQLSTYLIRLQDEERRRIARELHDSTGQKLILLKMSLEALATQLDLNPKKVAALSEAMQITDEATQDIRTLSQLLHPPLLDEAGLAVATKWLVQGFSERSGVAVSLHLPDNLERLPQNVEIALFRVMQEALNNIHRHSGASRADVRITQAQNQVALKIADNGNGFRRKSPAGSPPVGVGIQGMRERLGQLGGVLDITSGKKGTTITAKVPR